jgi:hypothetical protein
MQGCVFRDDHNQGLFGSWKLQPNVMSKSASIQWAGRCLVGTATVEVGLVFSSRLLSWRCLVGKQRSLVEGSLNGIPGYPKPGNYKTKLQDGRMPAANPR